MSKPEDDHTTTCARAGAHSRVSRGLVVVAVVLGIAVTGCGGSRGLFSDYNAKVVVETDDVDSARLNTKTLVQSNHDGALDKEQSEYGGSGSSTLTFRVPADQFDATIQDLDDRAIGTIRSVDITGDDNIEQRSDLTKVYDTVKESLKSLSTKPADLANAEKELRTIADRSNRPVLVVEIQESGSPLSSVMSVLTNRLLWVVIAFLVGRMFGARDKTKRQPELVPEIQRPVRPM